MAPREGLFTRYLQDRQAYATYWTFGWPSQSGLAKFDVLLIDNLSVFAYPPNEVKAIAAFVRSGGGLLLAGHAPQYFDETRERSAPEGYSLNTLSAAFGVSFLDNR